MQEAACRNWRSPAWHHRRVALVEEQPHGADLEARARYGSNAVRGRHACEGALAKAKDQLPCFMMQEGSAMLRPVTMRLPNAPLSRTGRRPGLTRRVAGRDHAVVDKLAPLGFDPPAERAPEGPIPSRMPPAPRRFHVDGAGWSHALRQTPSAGASSESRSGAGRAGRASQAMALSSLGPQQPPVEEIAESHGSSRSDVADVSGWCDGEEHPGPADRLPAAGQRLARARGSAPLDR